MNNDNKKILFFGTTMFQKRNEHNLLKDFEGEIPLFEQPKYLKYFIKIEIKKRL